MTTSRVTSNQAKGGQAMALMRNLVAGLRKRPSIERDGILAPAEFQAALRIERSRSDRSGWPFTLVVINVDNRGSAGAPAGAAQDVLLRVARQRTRNTDIIGWYGESVAIILPYTHRDSVPVLLVKLEESFSRHLPSNLPVGSAPELEYTVYSYPAQQDKMVEMM